MELETKNRCELIYGKSGSGKTTWWLALAEAIYRTHGLRTRCYLGDGGFETIDASGLIEDGIVEVFQYNKQAFPFETTMRCVQGWWPGRDGKLVPPNADLGRRYGLFVFEGLSVMSDYLMGDKDGGMRARNARGEKIKEAAQSFSDGESRFGTNSSANYGTVQEQMITRIEESRALPGWVQWTAHEVLAEDKKTLGKRDDPNAKVIVAGVEYGPDIVGNALTAGIGAMFGNTIHLHQVRSLIRRPEPDPVTKLPVEDVQIRYRAYTRRHLDPLLKSAGVTYFANNRMPPQFAEDMVEFLDPPNPIEFYRILAEGKRKARELRAASTPTGTTR